MLYAYLMWWLTLAERSGTNPIYGLLVGFCPPYAIILVASSIITRIES